MLFTLTHYYTPLSSVIFCLDFNLLLNNVIHTLSHSVCVAKKVYFLFVFFNVLYFNFLNFLLNCTSIGNHLGNSGITVIYIEQNFKFYLRKWGITDWFRSPKGVFLWQNMFLNRNIYNLNILYLLNNSLLKIVFILSLT